MKNYILKNGTIINEGTKSVQDILIKNGRIERIASNITDESAIEVDVEGKWVIPGIIDDQVHFREPGLTHKANIYSESKAAVAGGVTSFMEMPNTKPPAVTQELLQDKYDIGAASSLANYSFFMGASNDNIEEVLKTDGENVCGIKVFMGSSTGNMLVDNETTLRNLFSKVPLLMAAHCEDENTVRSNTKLYTERYGENIPISCHPEIRDVEACFLSSSMAVGLAKEYGTRFHVLHISTRDELELFDNSIPLAEKKITAEVCVHHLYFNKDDYAELGSKIKCNPAIKDKMHQRGIWKGLLDNRLDIIATDHAPHTIEEKSNFYAKAPAGVPLIQHTLNVMLSFVEEGKITIERVIEKMCHAPAICFKMKERGFIREGYWADIAVVDPKHEWTVTKDNILHKCGWSPFENKSFKGNVTHTFVSGHLAYENGVFNESKKGERLKFHKQH